MKLWLHVRNSKDDDLNVGLYILGYKESLPFRKIRRCRRLAYGTGNFLALGTRLPGHCNFREPLLIFQTSSYQMRMVISPDFTYYYTSGHGSFWRSRFFVQEWDLDRFGFDELGGILLLVKCFCNLHVGSFSRQMATSTLCLPLRVSCFTAGTAGALRVIWFALWVVLTYWKDPSTEASNFEVVGTISLDSCHNHVDDFMTRQLCMISCTSLSSLQAYTVDSIPAAVRRMHQSPICQPPGVCSTDWVSWAAILGQGWHDGGRQSRFFF